MILGDRNLLLLSCTDCNNLAPQMARVVEWVDNANANISGIPVLNDDSFLQTQSFPSRNWLGTYPDENLATQADHLLGVDLNWNNPPFWNTTPGRSSGDLNSLDHHGASPHSEPETQVLVTRWISSPGCSH